MLDNASSAHSELEKVHFKQENVSTSKRIVFQLADTAYEIISLCDYTTPGDVSRSSGVGISE